MNDPERGSREWDSLRSRVENIFEAPEGVAPTPTDVARSSRLRMWTRPSFDNQACWTVWGPPTPDRPIKPVRVRRVIWRADLDGDRANPMQRLQRIGKPLEPTIEVADARVDADDLAKRLRSLPLPDGPASALMTPRPTVLDGERYGLEIDANLSHYRIDWFGVDRDWTPSDSGYSAIASWAKDFSSWLNTLLDDS